MISPLLLGACSICGEPIFRHRTVDGRQISCEALRRIDQALQFNAAPPQPPQRQFQLIGRRRDTHGQGGGR